jgi:hypothetical protein
MNAYPMDRRPEPKAPIVSTVPPTVAEQEAAADRWERRGPLGRLVRRG